MLLGMMSKMPVPGVIWQNLQYLIGFRRLGFDPYYVEAHARTPSMLMRRPSDDSSARAAGLIARVMRRFGFADRWAFQALHEDGRCFGLSDAELQSLYRSASLIINLHGGTEPLDEHAATGRLIYLETDPVEVQLQLEEERSSTISYLEAHSAFFTFAENYRAADCLLPVSSRFDFRTTRQPVVIDLWERDVAPIDRFSTVANWRQPWRAIRYRGRTYHWSKDREFAEVLDLPALTGKTFELALSAFEEGDRAVLEGNEWRVRDAMEFGADVDAYRDFIVRSHAEFTVAKEQNVQFRTGWFSDRSASYLAAGRPVVTQDTGLGGTIPIGEGIIAYGNKQEAVEAVERIDAEYQAHAQTARELAREYFSHEVVLGKMLNELGIPAKPLRRSAPFPDDLDLTVVSRRPTRLRQSTVDAALRRPIPWLPPPRATEQPTTSVVVVTFNQLPLTRLCLESLLAGTSEPSYEVVVVDNGSEDGTLEYLHELARRHPQVRVLPSDENVGFARALNHGLDTARGEILLMLNNDTVVAPGWVMPLVSHLRDSGIGLVGPTTNRCGNEAEVRPPYRKFGGFQRYASRRARERQGRSFDIRTLNMFCVAMRREVMAAIGPVDTRFGTGLFEDDDYSMRARAAGYRVVCAEDAFVHHFGQGSFGELVPTGEYARLFSRNRRLFEEKWGVEWHPPDRRTDPAYVSLLEDVRKCVRGVVPAGSGVAVVTRGDEELLRLDGVHASHFPQMGDGSYAGFYPGDSAEAITQLETLRRQGTRFFVIPRIAAWWLEHYEGLRNHLLDRYVHLTTESDPCEVFD
ncbi:MAG: glycosyltransferase, partial [Actinomycetota bacterium]